MKHFSSFIPLGLLALFIFALRLPAAAQAPAWQSARVVAVATAAASSNFSRVTATAVDAVGNVYLAGNFTNTVALGSIALSSLGSQDLFVAKFNAASNQFVWAQRAGGTNFDVANALAVNGTSIYVAGNFGSTSADFGANILTNSGSNSTDVFVAKLTDAGSTGSFAWVQRAGGIGNEVAHALAVSGVSVYVAGYFTNLTTNFGPATLTNAGANTGTNDLFVSKLIDAGNTGSFVWAQSAGGMGHDQASGLAVSGTSVYVAGSFGSSSAAFGLATLACVGASDVFVAKLTDTGNVSNFVWAQRAGGTGDEAAYTLAVRGTSVYAAGLFTSPTAGFGATTLTNLGTGFTTADVFVTKLADAGSTSSFAWAQRAGGRGQDYATALAVSGSNIYVTGLFGSSTADFGITTMTNAGGNTGLSDVFVAKLTDVNNTGSFAWAQRAGGTGDDASSALAVSGTSVYIAGDFLSTTAEFGSTTLTNSIRNTPLGFLASLTDPTLTATAPGRTLALAQLFPNPARNTVTLRLPAGTAPAPLALTDALGRAVRQYPAPAGSEAALDLQGLPAGLYLLRGAGPAQRLAVE